MTEVMEMAVESDVVAVEKLGLARQQINFDPLALTN